MLQEDAPKTDGPQSRLHKDLRVHDNLGFEDSRWSMCFLTGAVPSKSRFSFPYNIFTIRAQEGVRRCVVVSLRLTCLVRGREFCRFGSELCPSWPGRRRVIYGSQEFRLVVTVLTPT